MDFGSLVLKTETDEKIEESNDLEKSNQTPSLTVNGKGKFPSNFLQLKSSPKKSFPNWQRKIKV